MLVESNPADSYLIVEGFKRAGFEGVRVMEDSQQALDYLMDQGQPDLILLDLNLAPISGLEVLARIRSEPRLEATPVIILSGSQNAADVRNAYRMRANCYIRKPNTLDEFLGLMKTCYEFWGTMVVLPPKSDT